MLALKADAESEAALLRARIQEQEAQAAYEQFVTESNASQKAKEEAVVPPRGRSGVLTGRARL